MPTYTYPGGVTVTIGANGDISIDDGANTTTYTKSNGNKTVSPNKPPAGAAPPQPQAPDASNPNPKGGGVEYTFVDTTKKPNVVTKIRFRPNGDVEIETDDNGTNTEKKYIAGTGVEEDRTWQPPAKRPKTPTGTVPPSTSNPNPVYTPPAPAPAPAPSPAPPPSGGGSAPDSDKDKKKPKKPKRPSKKTKAGGSRKTVSKPLKKALKKKMPVKRNLKKKMGKRKK